jgi:hypothetical protein
MPKLWRMAQISRPFQIALVAIVLLAGVWLFALHGSSKAPEASSSAAPSEPAQVPASPGGGSAQGGAASPGAAAAPAYHGSAPGVAGLTGAIAKAQGAVATSQQNAKQLEQKSAQASSPQTQGSAVPATAAAPSPATGKSSAAGTTAAHSSAPASGASAVGAIPAPSVSSSKVGSSKAAAPAGGTHHGSYQLSSSLVRQKSVEAALKAGNVVLVLFWDSKGTDDLAVLSAVRSFAHGHGKVVVQTAKASEVASFGSITRGVQVYGTPTTLVVGKSTQVKVLTGLTDAYSLEQAIAEARHS